MIRLLLRFTSSDKYVSSMSGLGFDKEAFVQVQGAVRLSAWQRMRFNKQKGSKVRSTSRRWRRSVAMPVRSPFGSRHLPHGVRLG